MSSKGDSETVENLKSLLTILTILLDVVTIQQMFLEDESISSLHVNFKIENSSFEQVPIKHSVQDSIFMETNIEFQKI